MELFAIVPLIFVVVFLLWFIYNQNKQFTERESKLLDRIMARNYEVLVQGDIAREQVKKSLTDEEIYALQEERGIPV